MRPLLRFACLPIRIQLFALAVLLTLPALGIIIYSGLKVRSEDYRNATIETQKLADNVVAEVVNLVHESERLGSILSDLPDVKEHNVSKVTSLLNKTIKRYGYYNAILVADSSGSIWASTSPVPAKALVVERRYFQSARKTKRFSSGEFVFSQERGIPTIHVAYPLMENDRFQGAIITSFNLERLRLVLERAQLSDQANFVVTDHRGIIISRGRNLGQEVSKPIQKADLRKMEAGPESDTYEFTRMDGERRIVSYRKIRLEGEDAPFLYVRAGISISEAVSRANRHLASNIALMLSLVVLSFILTILIGKRSIVDRIAVLKRASQDLAGGTLTFKVSDRITGGELGDLGQTFDTMARQLVLREQALRESEQNYRDIFNTTQDAIIVHDDAGEIVTCNSATEKLFGYSGAELRRLSIKDLMPGTPPHTFAEAQMLTRQSMEGNSQRFEWLSQKRSGEVFWSEISMAATTIAGKERVLFIVRDITKSKEIERLKEEMISSVTHEMRTPLTAMLGFLEFVKENPVEEPELLEYLDIMHKEAERLNEMVANFLNMQGLRASIGSGNLQPVEVMPLVANAAALFSGPAQLDRIDIDVPEDIPTIQGDESLLHQALVNLLSNAIKYSPPATVITVRARQERDAVVLSVQDQGIGIPKEVHALIFEAFYRVKGTTTRPGTGLGLALVKEIIQAHNGRIWVDSTPGEGSTFNLLLPIAELAQALP